LVAEEKEPAVSMPGGHGHDGGGGMDF
jgi:hypothetical protein